MRQCDSCGSDLGGGPAHKRFCSDTCRKRGNRGVHAEDGGSVTASTRAALEAAGRENSPAGSAALVLAAKLDRGGDTGSAVAALVRELRATMAEALANVAVAVDPVDELRRKREERQARAGGA